MYATIRYGPIFDGEDFVVFVVGLIIFILTTSMIKAGVLVFLRWDNFGQSLWVSLQMNVASTIFGMGIVLVIFFTTTISIWLATAIAFLLSVLIEGRILILWKPNEPYLNSVVVSLVANIASYFFFIFFLMLYELWVWITYDGDLLLDVQNKAENISLVNVAICLQRQNLLAKNCPTKRAPDVWDSARFTSIFLASSFSCSQALSTPAHTQVTQTVGRQVSTKIRIKRKARTL